MPVVAQQPPGARAARAGGRRGSRRARARPPDRAQAPRSGRAPRTARRAARAMPWPVAHEMPSTRGSPSSSRSTCWSASALLGQDRLLEGRDERLALVRRQQVELVQDDDLRQRGEALAVLHELVVDRRVARAAVGEQVVARLDRRRCAAARGHARGARGTRARGPTPSEAPSSSPGTSATVSCDPSSASTVPSCGSMRRERVVGDLRAGVRDAVEQRRLAGVREAEHRGIGEQLQPQLERALLAVEADLRGARRLARRASRSACCRDRPRLRAQRRRARRRARGRRRARRSRPRAPACRPAPRRSTSAPPRARLAAALAVAPRSACRCGRKRKAPRSRRDAPTRPG